MILELTDAEADVLRELVEHKMEDEAHAAGISLIDYDNWTDAFVSVAKKLGVNIDD